MRKCCIDFGVGSGMEYRVGLKIGWRETGNGGCGWAVALGGVPWCLYGKAGAHSHASDCADCAPLPELPQATPLHLCTSVLWSVPYTSKATRPRDLPSFPLPSCIARCWNSGRRLRNWSGTVPAWVALPPALHLPGTLSHPQGDVTSQEPSHPRLG